MAIEVAIHSAARQGRQGLYFFNLKPSSIADPEWDLRSAMDATIESGMQPWNVVFEMLEADLARDPAYSHRLREYLRSSGFGFAVCAAGMGGVCDFEPDYIKLERRLTQNIESAPIISRLVHIAERSGARVVAEGVDKVRMVENLWLLGVQFMQGHVFGDASPRIM